MEEKRISVVWKDVDSEVTEVVQIESSGKESIWRGSAGADLGF